MRDMAFKVFAILALSSIWTLTPCVAHRENDGKADNLHFDGHADSESFFASEKCDLNASYGDLPPEGYCAGPAEDKYEKGNDKLGEGAFGVTYRATLKTDRNQVFVMKKVPIDKFESVELGPMTKSIPFNLPLLGLYCPKCSSTSWRPEDSVSLILPLMDGGDLKRYDEPSRPDPMPKKTAAMIALGLYHLHSAGYIHRDFKGDNIMQKKNGALTSLIDYGLIASWKPNELVTENNTIIGNERYRAPERSGPYGPEVDWFSFGLLLYHSHVGKRMYRSSQQPKGSELRKYLHQRFSKGKYRDAFQTFGEFDEDLWELIAFLVHTDSSGKGIHNACQKTGCWLFPFAQGYPSINAHPVLTHPYWSAGSEKIDWQKLEDEWKAHMPFTPGLCQKKSWRDLAEDLLKRINPWP